MSRTLALAWFGAVVAMTPVSAQAPGKLYRVVVLAQVEQSRSVVQSVVVPELARMGFVQGENLAIDFRAGPPPELPHLARETLTRTPDAILAITTPAASAVRQASKDNPIVLFGGQDAVSEGLGQSLSQPGGNVTGVVILARDLDAKRLNLLHEIVPRARRIGYLMYSLSLAEPHGRGAGRSRRGNESGHRACGCRRCESGRLPGSVQGI